LLQKLRDICTADGRPGNGRRRIARTDEKVQLVDELVLSQDNKPQSHRMVREIAHETGIPQSSVTHIIHKCFKKRHAQELTDAKLVCNDHGCCLKSFQILLLILSSFRTKMSSLLRCLVSLQNDRLYTRRVMRRSVNSLLNVCVCKRVISVAVTKQRIKH